MRTFFVTLAVVLALPAAALAAGRDVIRDCTDDEKFSKTYTQKEYRDALANLSTDTDEYTNCRAVIRRAQLAAAAAAKTPKGGGSGGGGANAGGGGGGGGTTGDQGGDRSPAPAAPAGPSAAEQRALDDARASAQAAPDVRAASLDATRAGAVPHVEESSELPTSVIVLLVLLAAGLLAAGATRAWSVVRARRA
jgi:hypothetical protein